MKNKKKVVIKHLSQCRINLATKRKLDARIKEVFLENGFTIKEGETDLKPYVYSAAYALLWDAGYLYLGDVE